MSSTVEPGSPPSDRGDRKRGAAGRNGSPPSDRGDRKRGAAGRWGHLPLAGDGSPPSKQFRTHRGRRTQAAIDDAARMVIARKGILATTIADIATEAGRSAASFYNYYDSKEAMVREWALRFRDEANQRAVSVTEHGLSERERAHQAAAAHWHTYRHRLAEMISVSQLAMISDDFAQYWAQMCAIPLEFIAESVKRAQRQGFCPHDDPHLLAEAIVAMFNQFCYVQLTRTPEPDDQACIQTLANIYYRAIYSKEDRSL